MLTVRTTVICALLYRLVDIWCNTSQAVIAIKSNNLFTLVHNIHVILFLSYRFYQFYLSKYIIFELQ